MNTDRRILGLLRREILGRWQTESDRLRKAACVGVGDFDGFDGRGCGGGGGGGAVDVRGGGAGVRGGGCCGDIDGHYGGRG